MTQSLSLENYNKKKRNKKVINNVAGRFPSSCCFCFCLITICTIISIFFVFFGKPSKEKEKLMTCCLDGFSGRALSGNLSIGTLQRHKTVNSSMPVH